MSTTASLRPVQGEPREVLALLRSWWDDAHSTDADPHDPHSHVSIRTSGSTGEPKEVLLSREALEASATATLDRLGGPGQWLLALPTTAVAGLQVLVRSLLAGTEPVLSEDHPDLADAVAAMTGPRRYGALVPTQLHRLWRDGRLDVLAPLDAVLLGGASADPDLLDAADDAGVTIVRTYGMSETSGGCVYDGVPLDGVRLRIDDIGQVLVAGPTLFDGYADESGADKRGAGTPRPGEWFATGDLGTLHDGVLRITGRLDDVVKVGGAKVVLPAVEAAMRALSAVGEVAVVAVRDEEWGRRVVAHVVPSAASVEDELAVSAVRDALERGGLDRRSAPREVVLHAELPLLPGGKVDRARLTRG